MESLPLFHLYNKHTTMAEMNLPQKGGRKVQAPRIDLTPMVDLGFLLITFFMFTTTLAQQRAMQLSMPSPAAGQPPTVIPEESTLTLIATKGHKVVYYDGTLNGKEEMKGCATGKVTGIVLEKKKAVAALPANLSAEAHKLHVQIKPMDNSSYEDVVQLLDAMLIADVPYYVIMDVTEEEKNAISERY
jgi:biopolymer transport protein ExbD